MTTTDTSATVAEAVQRALAGSDLMIACPAHEDGTASLHVSPGDERVLLYCHAQCTTEAILTASGLDWPDLFADKIEHPAPATASRSAGASRPAPVSQPPPEGSVASDWLSEPWDRRVEGEVWTPAGNASHIYPYRDSVGNVLYEVLRVPLEGKRKTFRQRRPDFSGRYVWNLEGVERVLYRLPAVRAAVANGDTVYVAEGERDADSLVRLGLCGTTNAMGAGKWTEDYTKTLAGATVVIIADADETGRMHAREVRKQLLAVNCTVEIREAPHPHNDLSDLLNSGGTMDTLLVTVPAEESDRQRFGVDILDVVLRSSAEQTRWVIPGTMARKERFLLTGFEGEGKSMLIRQWAVMLAAGIHPFTLARIPPQKALLIDAENEPGQVLEDWQQLVGLANYHAEGIERGTLTVLEEWDNDEMDLSSPNGTSWLHERIHAFMPDIVLMGPLTNMVARDLKDDEPVRKLKHAVNSGRSICGSAFVMEHHAPHKNPSDKQRSVRPYGSSMFLKWPDFGYGLQPIADVEGTYEWKRTRRPRVRRRAWPTHVRWGTPNTSEWPWLECGEPS